MWSNLCLITINEENVKDDLMSLTFFIRFDFFKKMVKIFFKKSNNKENNLQCIIGMIYFICKR